MSAATNRRPTHNAPFPGRRAKKYGPAPRTGATDDRGQRNGGAGLVGGAPYGAPVIHAAVAAPTLGAGHDRRPACVGGEETARRSAPDEFRDVGGRRPYDVLQNHVQMLAMAFQQMKDGELNAIEQFLIYLGVEEPETAEPDLLGALFEAATGELWGGFVKALGPHIAIPAAIVESVIGKVAGEMRRTGESENAFETRAFCARMRTNVTATYQAAIVDIQTSGRYALEDELERRQAHAGGCSMSPAILDYLRRLERGSCAVLRGLPSPVAYEQRFLAKWVTETKAGGGADPLSTDGVIRIHIDVTDGRRRVLERAAIYTSHRPDRAAAMLNRILKETGQTVMDCGIPVEFHVRMKTRDKGRHVVAFLPSDNYVGKLVTEEERAIFMQLPSNFWRVSHVEGG